VRTSTLGPGRRKNAKLRGWDLKKRHWRPILARSKGGVRGGKPMDTATAYVKLWCEGVYTHKRFLKKSVDILEKCLKLPAMGIKVGENRKTSRASPKSLRGRSLKR
jgi:hypothetical protein